MSAAKGTGTLAPDRSAAGVALTFYGDDFTGSTDVMEALELAGVPTVLFLKPPTPDSLAAHPDAAAVGVAGLARTMSPEQMAVELPPVLDAIAALRSPVFHYKVCSTFDSSPVVGSIGRAAELVRAAFGAAPVPVVVGVPELGRFTAFGHLFATAADGVVHRIDRHPTMSRHPMTPMTESDLLVHLGRQTSLVGALVDHRAMSAGNADADAAVEAALASGAALVLLDVADRETQRQAGRQLDRLIRLRRAEGRTLAVIGSSGVEYALGTSWSSVRTERADRPGAVQQTLAVAGSRSPATDAQIAAALADGFADVLVDPVAVTEHATARRATDDLVRAVGRAWGSGSHVLLRTPPRRADRPVDGTALASALGTVAGRAVREVGARRLVVAGGDTSGFVTRELDIEALRMVQPIAPGAPLCRVTSADPSFDGMEICLKSGQVGAPDFLVRVARLGSSSSAQPETPTV